MTTSTQPLDAVSPAGEVTFPRPSYGVGHRLIPGGGLARRRRPRPLDLGHILQDAGQGHRRPHGDDACDHYRRYRDDVALMKSLNLQVYRFSVSWSRVMPDGRTVNPEGLKFYSDLVDELLAAGIMPWLTQFHWDLPQALEDEGGWTNRQTAYAFEEYARVLHGALGTGCGIGRR